PVALIKREGSLAESIIEECMLAANETVARHMDTKNLPFMYRVHEQPSEEKIERLNNLLAAFGLFVKQDEQGHIQPMDVQKVLEKVEGRPEERIISTVSLRSMQQARYSELSLGHFGLAARYYTHFTSPIRRYPDLIVHRLLRETFATGSLPVERQAKLKMVLPEIADHTSQRERVAIEAERETTDMKKIEYMAQFVGEEFTGVISGVTAFGIFVELDNGVEGLVHVSTMTNDYYEYVEEQYAMIGERTRTRYRLGDEVEVILARANVEERNLDFVLKDNGQYVPERPAQKGQNSNKGKGERKPKAPRPKKKPLLEDELIAEPMLTEEETKQKEQKEHKPRKHNGHKKRGASGEKLAHTDKREGEGRKPKADRSRRQGKAERADKESRMGAGSFRGENRRNREERRSDKEVGYHRVYVTGLNSAVWPDPPGYHEKKERELAAAAAKAEKEKSKKSRGSRRPRPHRKTEGGTANSK
ncbi:MAG: RNB domain-containing ribonuclease, partial [Selenomonas sp.]|nr:RNB domain-containing ribonuclease [Selenomonas sp.]